MKKETLPKFIVDYHSRETRLILIFGGKLQQRLDLLDTTNLGVATSKKKGR